MLQKIPIIIVVAIAFFLTGCAKQSTFVNVNLPLDDVRQDVNTVFENNTNTNTNNAITSSNTNISNITNNNANTNKNIISTTVNSNINTPASVPTQVEIPAKLELDVDFAPQAPYGNWDVFHDEACEEASIVVASKYFLNQPLNEAIMDQELYKLDAWEKDHGYKIDLSAQEAADVIKAYFNLPAKVVDDVNVDRIKYELSLGNLVIVPAAGRELNNPYFRTPGPIYHMLVIKGYNSSEFITNEVGTKRGDGFRYKYQVLIDAVHDWDPSWSHDDVIDAQISSQPKRMVIVSK